MLDVRKIREDFHILGQRINGKPLVYFDNGATAQKPKPVIDAIVRFYTEENSNIHRGVHTLSRRATEHYERARIVVQKHLGAASDQEIIFTRGTTESINLVASCFGKTELNPGDEILVSEMEHHSNILPWQLLCEEKKAVLRYIPVDKDGTLRMTELEKLLTARTRLVAVSHVSNTTGIINPVREIVMLAHEKNIPVLLDGAQAVPHMAVNVSELGCDFYCFSGHKVFAPTGIGALYMKRAWMERLAPYQVGGGTIKTVSFGKTEYVEGPLRYEAGTPNIEGAIGLAEALTYINTIGLATISAYEDELLQYASDALRAIKEVTLYGDVAAKAAVISFNAANIHPFDVGTILDQQGVAVRTGHHCTQPLMHCFGIPGTVRVSFAFYNTKEEIDLFIAALKKAIRMLS